MSDDSERDAVVALTEVAIVLCDIEGLCVCVNMCEHVCA